MYHIYYGDINIISTIYKSLHLLIFSPIMAPNKGVNGVSVAYTCIISQKQRNESIN